MCHYQILNRSTIVNDTTCQSSIKVNIYNYLLKWSNDRIEQNEFKLFGLENEWISMNGNPRLVAGLLVNNWLILLTIDENIKLKNYNLKYWEWRHLKHIIPFFSIIFYNFSIVCYWNSTK